MICPHCGKAIKVDMIEHQRGKGFAAQIQCPHCQVWLGRTPWLLQLKMVSFYLMLLAVVVVWWWPASRHFGIPLGILALIALLMSHLMDQLKVTEKPPVPDDSQQRQKYR
ncbi:hypothetical protein [Shewanella sp. YIC-542]|uniref:hypothetical protein n=1 Tax=Shewanella mytili TaxID=3377111 RepID=UPI00398EF841